MNKNRIPDGISEESIEAPDQDSLYLFLDAAKQLAREEGIAAWSGSYNGPDGKRELVATYPKEGIPSGAGKKIRTILYIFSPALRRPEDPAESGDETYFDEYALVENDREDDVAELEVLKSHYTHSKRQWQDFRQELVGLQHTDPEAAREIVREYKKEIAEKRKAEREAHKKGANRATRAEIEGLNVYLQQFIDELKAEEAKKQL
jgi:hypothetical protein